MVSTAVFAQTPKTASAVAALALGSITTDTPTGAILLMTAGAKGAILTRLTAMPRATVSASSLCLFLSNDGGATMRLIDSESMPLQTVAAGNGISETIFGNYTETRPLRLGAGDMLYVGTQVTLAAGIVFRAEYTDY